MRTQFEGWHAGVIVADEELGHALGLRADKRYVLYNGALECKLLIFELKAAAEPRERVDKPLSDGAQSVVNRIRKNHQHLRKRLQREGISCYRIYDADLPEYSAAIDVFTATARDDLAAVADEAFPQIWLHVQEYAPPKEFPNRSRATACATSCAPPASRSTCRANASR